METNQETLPTTYKAEVNLYDNASQLKVTEEEQTKLLASFDTNQIEIRPDGLIYLPQTFWRQRLNETFGIGQWCLIPKGSHKDPSPDKDKLYLQGVMMVRGVFVAEAVGEAELHSDNPLQSWASVWESAKSDCITRCCKDLGIASELWQPQFVQDWIAQNAIKVFVKLKNGSKKVNWRKKDSQPFWNEEGVAMDQPSHYNQKGSENGTQPQEEKQFDPTTSTVGFGKHKGKKWAELEESYLKFLLGSDSPSIKADAQTTLDYLSKKNGGTQQTITDQYTQSEPEKPVLTYDKAVITFGTYKGKKFTDLPVEYLQMLANDGKQPQAKKFAQETLNAMFEKEEMIEAIDNAIAGISDMVRERLHTIEKWSLFVEYVRSLTHLKDNQEFQELVRKEAERFPQEEKTHKQKKAS